MDFEVWFDNEVAWSKIPEPDAVFEAKTAEEAAVLASKDAVFDRWLTSAWPEYAFIVRKKNGHKFHRFVFQSEVTLKLTNKGSISLKELKGE